jgi:hypothetical protein
MRPSTDYEYRFDIPYVVIDWYRPNQVRPVFTTIRPKPTRGKHSKRPWFLF